MRTCNNISGLQEIAVFLSPMVVSLIIGGSNVYKVLFLMLLLYIIFGILIFINAFRITPIEIKLKGKNSKNGSFEFIQGCFWQSKCTKDLMEIESMSVTIPPDINVKLSGEKWENIWNQTIDYVGEELTGKKKENKIAQHEDLIQENKKVDEEEEEEEEKEKEKGSAHMNELNNI